MFDIYSTGDNLVYVIRYKYLEQLYIYGVGHDVPHIENLNMNITNIIVVETVNCKYCKKTLTITVRTTAFKMNYLPSVSY